MEKFKCNLCSGAVPQEGLCEDCTHAMAHADAYVNYPSREALVEQLLILRELLETDSGQTVSFSIVAAVFVHNVEMTEKISKIVLDSQKETHRNPAPVYNIRMRSK